MNELLVDGRSPVLIMGWLLNIAYCTLLLALTPFLLYKSWRTGKYRAGWSQKLWGNLPFISRDQRVIWFHAVSVGEVLLLKPLVKLWRQANPHDHLVLTVTTSTGYKVACDNFPEITISYAPLDFTWSVKRAIDHLKPNLICLVELELWPNLIYEANRQNIPIGIVNARLSEKSHRGYAKIKWLMQAVLKKLAFVLAQDETIAQRFIDLGTPAKILQVTGSMKFDGVDVTQNQPKIKKLRGLLSISPADRVLIAGSTHSPEEEIILKIYKQICALYPQLKLLIAPRHAERFNEVAGQIQSCGFSVIRKSQLVAEQKSQPINSQPATSTKALSEEILDLEGSTLLNPPQEVAEGSAVILLDTLGELSLAWGLADIAYVGGSLGCKRGGQNMLEPAAYGAAVITGPDTWNFSEIMKQLLSARGVVQVSQPDELLQKIIDFIEQPHLASNQGECAKQLISSHQGATMNTYEHMLECLTPATSPSDRQVA